MKLSFVIPVWNNKKYLRQCVEAILKQKNIPDFEVLVVDNASTDDCIATIRDLPIKILNEPNRGRSKARNRGWREAKGEFIAFIDSDTILDQHWAYHVLQAFYCDDIGCLQGKVIPSREVNDSLQRYRYQFAVRSKQGMFCDIASFHEDYPSINTAACCFKKETLIELSGFNEELIICEDTDLSRRAYAYGWSLGHAPEALAFCYWHGKGWWDYFKRAISFYSMHLDFKDLWHEIVTEEEKSESRYTLWKRKMKLIIFPDTSTSSDILLFELLVHYVSRCLIAYKLWAMIGTNLKQTKATYPPLIRAQRPGSEIPKFIDNSNTIVLSTGDMNWMILEDNLRDLFRLSVRENQKGKAWKKTSIAEFIHID